MMKTSNKTNPRERSRAARCSVFDEQLCMRYKLFIRLLFA